MPHAVIVGAGINGLSTAWALVKRGWSVDVIDSGPIPNPWGASYDHHRLIRSQYAGRPVYAARIALAHAAWSRMWSDLGESHLRVTGMMAISELEGDWTDAARRAFDDAGIAHTVLLPDEIEARFAFLRPGRARYMLLKDGDGLLFARRILTGLADWLRGSGSARLMANTRVAHISAGAPARPGALAHCDDGTVLSGDAVVVTAGTGLADLAPASIGATLQSYRSNVVYVAPPEPLATQLQAMPCWVDLGGHDDLWGMPPLEGIAMKLGLGVLTRPHAPNEAGRRMTQDEVVRILAAYDLRIPGLGQSEVVEAVANYYVMAPEERFVLERDGEIYFLSACSGHGFKFGALTGEDMADALTGTAFETVRARVRGVAL